ncbi:hypothetical protein TNCV_2094861 [Trichonephila clavipes]|nr:hypothetical protein TNCV_2094861 [Trichonephila clavipes]
MMVYLVESALLVNLLCENKGNASAAVGEIRRGKNLLQGTMSTKNIWTIIKRFEELGAQPGEGHKRVKPVHVDGVKTAVDAHYHT